jgi:pilus assembly protein Flp/PilA
MTRWLQALWQDEEAPTAVEYALLVALIAVIIIAGATALGNNVNLKLNGVANNIRAGK